MSKTKLNSYKIKYERTIMQRNFLLSFFDAPDKYEEKLVNNFWLVKQYSRTKNAWHVAIFEYDKFMNRRKFNTYRGSFIKNPRGNSESEAK